MSEASLTALLGPDAARRVREPIETARPLAGAAYTSEAYHRLEMERVLGRSWTGVGFAHPKTGICRTIRITGRMTVPNGSMCLSGFSVTRPSM